MKLVFTGDIALHGLFPDKIQIAPDILELFKKADMTIGNLETPLTNSVKKSEMPVINLKADKNSTVFLKYFNVLNIGNNHIFDYDIEGFLDTVKLLKQNNIRCFGAGLNISEAQKPLKIEFDNNKKIAFIAGTRWDNASKRKHGTSGYKGHRNAVRHLKQKGYFVIYYPHWGYEYIQTPPPDVRRHAKKMIDYGVDLIIGTHPHVLQGYELYKNKYIFYSLGNFIFDNSIIEKLAPENAKTNCKKSAVLIIDIENEYNYKCEIHPTTFSNSGIEYAAEDERRSILAEIDKYSEVFKKDYLQYIKCYYKQVPEIIKQNNKIREKFQNSKELKPFKSLQLYRNVIKQDILNRIYYLTQKNNRF